jgi:signal transduction histidine kinase
MGDNEKLKLTIAELLAKESPDWLAIEEATRQMVEADTRSVRFTVDAGHIQRLGAELVGKQDTALSELIKNAYDADATKVTLNFSGRGAPGGTLVIADDGSGMTDDVIRRSWMRISTASKVDEPMSALYRRVRAGRKGIGRFSVQRLGKELILETRPRGESTGYRVKFNWDAEFVAGRDLNQVFSQIERFDKEPDDHGTRLSIFDLRDAWADSALAKVWRAVILLQPPFPVSTVSTISTEAGDIGAATDPGFAVEINGRSREQQRTEYSIEKSFLSQAFAKIEASIDADGNATVSVNAAKIDLSDQQRFQEKFLLTGPVNFSAFYFIYIASTLSGMTQAVAGEMGRNFGGIRIYRNGFRVLPYGERSDDWLSLDADVSRRELIIPANNRNFFGQAELSSTLNPLFEETSSREGLLENEAYFELRRFVRNAVEWAAKRVAAARKRKQDAGQRDFTAEPRKPSDLIRNLLETLGGEPHPDLKAANTQRALAQVEAVAAEFEASVEKERARSLEYEEMLRLLASLGLSISVFGHEVKGAKDAITARLALLADAVARVENTKHAAELDKQRVGLEAAADRMFDIGGYIAGLMSSTESRQLRSLSVKGALDRFAEQFAGYMGKQGVSFDIDVQPLGLRTTPMHASELDSVLLNFLTNSIKSMRQSKVSDRRVRMDARRDDRHIVIGFEDNGVGVAPEDRDRVFDAFFTTTMAADDDGVAGPGSGLGLKIVSDIASSYGGDATIGEPSAGYNCRFEIRILSAEVTT